MKTILAAALVALGAPALAQEAAPAAPTGRVHVIPGRDGHVVRLPSLAVAVEGAQAAMDACKAHGYPVGVTIVDDGGGVRLTMTADGAPTEGPNGALRKALTSALEKMSGADLVEKVKTDAALAANMKTIPDALAREGAVLIHARDGQLIGVIGVEGNPHDLVLDEACAKAGADRIQARLK